MPDRVDPRFLLDFSTMNRMMKIFVPFAISVCWASSADAQFAVPVWTQPAPVVIGSPVIVNRPAFVAPPIVVAPSIVVAPAPVMVSRPPIMMYQPTRELVTRPRPILGGNVTRVRYRYRPVFF